MAATLTPLIGGSSAPYLYLLPPCLVLLAIDIAVRKFSPRHSMFNETTEEQESSEPIPANPPPRRSRYPQDLSLVVSTQKLSSKARQVRALFSEYERQLSKDGASSPSLSSSSESSSTASSVTSSTNQHTLSLELRRCRALTRTCSDPTPYTDIQQVDRAVTRVYKHKPKKATCPIFSEFCVNILKEAVRQGTLVAKQKDAEIEALKQTLAKESQTERRSIEVQASDGIDHEVVREELEKAQKEAEDLRDEKERMSKAGEAIITRAAQKMVLETEKDRLVEGFVKEILDEAQSERRAICEMREEHEKEMREMVSEWRKEQRAMRRQIDSMRRALEAKAMEQEISNELEERLFSERVRRSTKDDVEVVDEYTQEIAFGSEDGDRTLLDDMSMLSASSTCVGSAGNSPQPTPSKSGSQRIKAELSVAIPRRRRAYSMCCDPPPPPVREPRKPVDPSEFVGFSFNPLFFGEGAEKPRSKSVMSTVSIESDDLSWSGKSQGVSSDGRPRSRRTSMLTRPTPLRIAWRV